MPGLVKEHSPLLYRGSPALPCNPSGIFSRVIIKSTWYTLFQCYYWLGLTSSYIVRNCAVVTIGEVEGGIKIGAKFNHPASTILKCTFKKLNFGFDEHTF
jgi:hypothetical protein